eukprot:2597380-Pleurochrysis_carterae.AAC.3
MPRANASFPCYRHHPASSMRLLTVRAPRRSKARRMSALVSPMGMAAVRPVKRPFRLSSSAPRTLDAGTLKKRPSHGAAMKVGLAVMTIASSAESSALAAGS